MAAAMAGVKVVTVAVRAVAARVAVEKGVARAMAVATDKVVEGRLTRKVAGQEEQVAW